MKYLIVSNGDTKAGTGCWEIVGFTETLSQAREMVREDAICYFDSESVYDDVSGNCMRYAIYVIKDAIRPVPTIRVEWSLKNIMGKL